MSSRGSYDCSTTDNIKNSKNMKNNQNLNEFFVHSHSHVFNSHNSKSLYSFSCHASSVGCVAIIRTIYLIDECLLNFQVRHSTIQFKSTYKISIKTHFSIIHKFYLTNEKQPHFVLFVTIWASFL